MKESITDLRKWNLIAGGNDPKNDVVPASVSYGLEDALQFAMSEIVRIEIRIKQLEEAGDAMADHYDPWTFIHWTKARGSR